MQVNTEQVTSNVSQSESQENVINENRTTRYICITFLPFENNMLYMTLYNKSHKDLVLTKMTECFKMFNCMK